MIARKIWAPIHRPNVRAYASLEAAVYELRTDGNVCPRVVPKHEINASTA